MTQRLSSIALSLLILVMAAIAIAMVAVPGATGLKAFTVDRNSMQSVIPFGSLEYSRAQDAYAVGDPVVFTHNGNLVTHFLHEELPNPATGELDGSWWRTKGSENLEPDDWEVSRDNIVGKVVWYMPLAGIATKVVATPTVAIFTLLIAGGLWWLSTSKPQNQSQAPRSDSAEWQGEGA